MDTLARRILNAIEGGDIEAIHDDDGKYRLLTDLKLVLELDSIPEVGVTPDHRIRVICGITDVASIQADDAADAENIADALRFCFSTCREPAELSDLSGV